MSDRNNLEFATKSVFIGANSAFSENFSAIRAENDDMTENSDSGFTEIDQAGSSDISQHAKSKTSSPEPKLRHKSEPGESSVDPVESPSLDNRSERTSNSSASTSKSSTSDSSSSDSDDSEDDDYDESDGSRSSVIGWVRQQMQKGSDPRDIIKVLLHNFHIPDNMSEAMLWRIISFAVTPQRERLSNVRTLSDAVQHIRQAKHIIILTGAGVSVSCGIPDFRSRDGVYSRLSREYPNLPDPQAMFDIKFFYQDPRPFYKFAREIFPGQFKPSPSHRFIKKLEERGVLLRNYTQNIDTLERVAGISRLIECHGSFATASCTRCKFRINGDAIRENISQQRIPVCFLCNPNQASQNLSTALNDETTDSEHLRSLVEMGIFKPDIVFFGEELPDDFHDSIDTDRNKCDLLIVIGSSLKVKPVAMIPNLVPPNVPQILINREPLPHMNFDVNLYGDSDVIIHHLYSLLDSTDKDDDLCWLEKSLEETTIELPAKAALPSPVEIPAMLSEIAEEPATILKAAEEPATISEPVDEPSTNAVVVQELATAPEAEKPTTSSEKVQLPASSPSTHTDSLSHLLPENTFAQISPRCYIFPGAEVTLDNMEAESEESDDEFDDDDEDDDENETASASANEIIVPDIDNVLSIEVPVPESSPLPTASSPQSPTPLSSSQLQCNDPETAENIAVIHADEASDDLEPAPIKRPRLESDAVF